MLKMLHKMSLRSRLVLLTAVSILALLIALTSAWRTARMSETFAYRQAESSVSSSVRELLREARDFPAGRDNSSQNENKKKLAPHESEILARYRDPLMRSAAIALHRSPETAGGFCIARAGAQGLATGENFGAISAAEREIIENICRQIQTTNDVVTQKVTAGSEILLISAAPTLFENNTNESSLGTISGAFAFRRLPPSGGFGDRFNLLTQGFLLVSVVGLTVFSFLTWRDWKSGMKLIETGLRRISGDLHSRIDPPPMPELTRMSDSINDLAMDLDENLRRQRELEQSLVKNEKLAALGRVVAGVAHEVRNPLASMKLKIQLAERGKFEPGQIEKTFNVLREEIDRLDNLVKKLLDVSRPARLNLSTVSLTNLIQQRFSLLAEKAAGKKVSLEFKSANENTEILADSERLAQVFDNLFRNALDAMPNGGSLKVSLEKGANVYRLVISDNGTGFSEAERERLFEPFFTTKENGTGLGLTISREIIEAHGGTIILRSDTAAGAAFVIELPFGPGS